MDYLSHRTVFDLFDFQAFSLPEYLFFMFPFQLFPNSLQLRKNNGGGEGCDVQSSTTTGNKDCEGRINLYGLKIVTLVSSSDKGELDRKT